MKDDIQTFDVVVIGAGPGGYVSAIMSLKKANELFRVFFKST